jgi:uncharacterized membrane protein
MDDFYNLLKFLHVLLAITWVGSGICLAILAVRAQKSQQTDAMARFSADASFVGEKILGPISGVLLLMGIFLVLKGPWGFGDTWILVGIAGWAISAAVGIFYLGPRAKQLDVLLREKGASDPESVEKIRQILLISRLDILVLVVVVADMVFKPGY